MNLIDGTIQYNTIQYSTAVNFFSSHRHFYSLSTCQFVLHVLSICEQIILHELSKIYKMFKLSKMFESGIVFSNLVTVVSMTR